MKIVLFGTGGKIGRVIADELLLRSHQVTGMTRGGNVAGSAELAMTVNAADVTTPDVVADLVKDHIDLGHGFSTFVSGYRRCDRYRYRQRNGARLAHGPCGSTLPRCC